VYENVISTARSAIKDVSDFHREALMKSLQRSDSPGKNLTALKSAQRNGCHVVDNNRRSIFLLF
jgi:hypothetical protein